MKNTLVKAVIVITLSASIVNCAGGNDVSSKDQGSDTGNTQTVGIQPVSTLSTASANPISLYSIPAGVPADCTYLDPQHAKSLSDDTILWLASLQTSGLTLAENYYVARQTGYTGAFGQGQHLAWLAQDKTRQATFDAAVSQLANGYVAGFGTFAQHHLIRRAAGYRGVFMCGGDMCFQAGQCDNLGRAYNN